MTLYPGTYQLRKHMPASSVAAILSDPRARRRASSTSTRGSGCPTSSRRPRRSAQIDESEFQKIIDAKGEGILPAEAGGNFEGWLEPGKYDVKGLGSAQKILKTIVDKRVSKLNEMHVPTGSERQRLLIIASIAEAEVNSSDYYGKVTRVILNRLDRDMTLGMDSTTAYGLGINGTQLTNAQLNDFVEQIQHARQQGTSPPRPSAIRETAPSRRR